MDLSGLLKTGTDYADKILRQELGLGRSAESESRPDPRHTESPVTNPSPAPPMMWQQVKGWVIGGVVAVAAIVGIAFAFRGGKGK